jgi:hypothetical protein
MLPTPNAQRLHSQFGKSSQELAPKLAYLPQLIHPENRYLITSNENNEKNPVPCNAVNPVVFMQP